MIDDAALARLRREVERRVHGAGLRRPAAVRAVAREAGVDPHELYRRLAAWRGKSRP